MAAALSSPKFGPAFWERYGIQELLAMRAKLQTVLAERSDPALTPAPFGYGYWERFDAAELPAIRGSLDTAIAERERQFTLFEVPRPESPRRDEAAPAAASPETDLGSVLSPSQVKTFLDCSARWWFQYAAKLPNPQSSFLALGKSVHRGLETNWRHKLAHGRDMDAPEVVETFGEAWEAEAAETQFRADDDIDELRAMGARLVEKFMQEAAPAIQPAAIEQKVTGEIGGVEVVGFIDLRDAKGRIIDVKTAAKKPSGVDPMYAFQVATYRQLDASANGEATIYTLTKTKTPQLIEQSYTVTVEDQMATQRQYPLVQAGIRHGLFFPHRGSNLCSKRLCNFWSHCQSEYGGRIDD